MAGPRGYTIEILLLDGSTVRGRAYRRAQLQSLADQYKAKAETIWILNSRHDVVECYQRRK